MEFNNTTQNSGIAQDIDFLVGTDENSYPLKDKARNTNIWNTRVIDWILESQDNSDFDDKNKTDFPISLTDLFKDQQDYSLPLSDEIVKVRRLEITYDGVNWYKMEPFDINESGVGLSLTEIASRFQKTRPYYDLLANSIFLYPIPTEDQTEGLKIFYARNTEDLFSYDDTTKKPGFDAQFHRVLSLGGAYDWAIAKGDTTRASFLVGELAKFEDEIRNFYSRKQADRKLVIKSAYNISDYR